MPRITIQPDRTAIIKYEVPKDGVVEFEIEADKPVRSYIVRPKGLELFQNGSKTFKYYGGFPDARKHQHQEVRLPFLGTWYLLISNHQDSDVDVEYDVFY